MDSAVQGYSDDVRIIYETSIRVELNFGNSGDSSLTKQPLQFTSAELTCTARSQRQAGAM